MKDKTVMQKCVCQFMKDGSGFSDWFFLNFDKLIELEKNQIIDAHFEGWGDAYDYLKNDDNAPRQAIDYYKENYER